MLKKSFGVVGLALALAWTLALQFQPASARVTPRVTLAPAAAAQTKPSGVVPVKAARATVRVGRKSYVIGTLFGPRNPNPNVTHKDHFDAQLNDSTAHGWSWGRALGNVGVCGFIQLDSLAHESSSSHTASCGRAPSGSQEYRKYLCSEFAQMTNNEDNHGTSVRTQSATVLWANFGSGGPADKLFDIPRDREVLWRWVTKRTFNGHHYVMVNFIVRQRDPHNVYPAGKSLWGYVKLSDLKSLTNRRAC
ncbi:MAG TPA: hypothetical protein VE713_02290 [Pyrinomonadaceae bacterium]|nr:hypothetical protein [Pyrinomonadaceae bacterium]